MLEIIDPVRFYQTQISERESFSNFMIGFDKPVIELFSKISKKFKNYKDNIIWVGGSRSWNNRFNRCESNIIYNSTVEFVNFLQSNKFFGIDVGNVKMENDKINLSGTLHETFQSYRLLMIMYKHHIHVNNVDQMYMEIERENNIYILEGVSIIPGNFDIFLLSSNFYDTDNSPNNVHKTIVCNVLEELQNFKKLIQDTNFYGDYYNVEIVKNKINTEIRCEIDHSYERNFCTLFPCQSIELQLKLKTVKEYRVNKRDNFISDKLVKKSLVKDLDLPLKEMKIVIYFESSFIPGLDLQKFKSVFLNNICGKVKVGKIDEDGQKEHKIDNIDYLNDLGLLFMNEMISRPRTHKGIYVDKYRRDLLINEMRALPNGRNLVYEMYRELYYNLFHEFKIHNILLERGKYLRGDIVKNMFLHSGTDIEEYITGNFINMIRPYTNSFLEYLNNELNNILPNCVLVLVGGDAMRRYDISVTNTSDFDCRIYTVPLVKKITTRRNVTEMDTSTIDINDFLINKLSEFVTLLNVLNENTTREVQYIPINMDNDITKRDNISIKYSTRTHGNQFRLRYVERGKFPVNLFSIDFISDYQVTIGTDKIIKPMTIAFLDIVVKEVKKINIVPNLVSGIPILSIEDLLSDLKYTYSPRNTQAVSRYWNNKTEKDLFRYNRLSQMNNKCNGDIKCFGNTYELNTKSDINWKSFVNQYTMDIQNYSNKFKELILINTKNKISKHKMKYSSNYDTYDNYLDQMIDLDKLNINSEDVEMDE